MSETFGSLIHLQNH